MSIECTHSPIRTGCWIAFLLFQLTFAQIMANPLVILNDQGQALFTMGEEPAQLVVFPVGPGTTWVDLTGPVEPGVRIAREGDAAPGFSGQFIDGIAPFFDINASGVAAFKAGLVDGLGNESGAVLYIGQSAETLTPIAYVGQSLDASTVSDVIPRLRINAAGQLGFKVELTSDDDAGFYRYTPDVGIETMLRLGTDLLDSTSVIELGGQATLNAAGSMLAKPRASSGEVRLYLLQGPGQRIEVARIGGAGPGGVFTDIGGSIHNDANQVLFKAEVDEQQKLLLFSPMVAEFSAFNMMTSDYVEVAWAGQAVGADATLAEISNSFTLNHAGQVAFVAELTGIDGVGGEDPAGIYFWDGATLMEAARSGDIFNDMVFIANASPVALDDQGSMFFLAEFLLGEDVVKGVYTWNEQAGLTELLREGMLIDDRMITSITALNATFDRHVNQSGQIGVQVEFDYDEDHAYVVVVPEPSSIALLAGLAALLVTARRRRSA
jgi:hypothetical protein